MWVRYLRGALRATGTSSWPWTPTPKGTTLNSGRSPILGAGGSSLSSLSRCATGRLRAMGDPKEAIEKPTSPCLRRHAEPLNGSLDTRYVLRAAEEIGRRAQGQATSTSLSSGRLSFRGRSMRWSSRRSARDSGKMPGVISVSPYHPEFLRESTAIKDYYEPGAIVSSVQLDPDDPCGGPRTLVGMSRHLPVEPNVVPIRRPRPSIRQQLLARGQDQLRQRDRQHLQGVGHRQPRGDGHPLRRYAAQHLARPI